MNGLKIAVDKALMTVSRERILKDIDRVITERKYGLIKLQKRTDNKELRLKLNGALNELNFVTENILKTFPSEEKYLKEIYLQNGS